MTTVTYNLPAFWATALFYDDTSAFESYEDDKQFQDFCAYMLKEHGSSEPVDCSEERGFMKYHDATRFGVLACDVLEFTFIEGRGNPVTSAMVTLSHTMGGE